MRAPSVGARAVLGKDRYTLCAPANIFMNHVRWPNPVGAGVLTGPFIKAGGRADADIGPCGRYYEI